MKRRQAVVIARQMFSSLPGFMSDGSNKIFVAPIGHTLRAFLFESSSYTKEDFYFHGFFMPLCRPMDFIGLSYGERLISPNGTQGWRTDMPDLPKKLLAAMQPEALPLLRRLNTIQDTIAEMRRRMGPRANTDTHALDEISCLNILDGRFDEALTTLDVLIAEEHDDNKYNRSQWILDIYARAKGLREKLLKDPQLAVRQVKEWQDFTFKALKLEKWR